MYREASARRSDTPEEDDLLSTVRPGVPFPFDQTTNLVEDSATQRTALPSRSQGHGQVIVELVCIEEWLLP